MNIEDARVEESKEEGNGRDKDEVEGSLDANEEEGVTAKNFKNPNLDILEFEAPSNCQAWENQVT